MPAPVAGAFGVGQVPGVDLDEHGAAVRQLLGDVIGQRPIGQHLVHVDSEQPLQVGVPGFGVGELITLPVGSYHRPERRPRLVAARVQQLDQDVGIAVGLQVRTARPVELMRLVVERLTVRRGHIVTHHVASRVVSARAPSTIPRASLRLNAATQPGNSASGASTQARALPSPSAIRR